MKILITGSTGLLGQALSAKLAPKHKVTGLSRHAPLHHNGGHIVCDLLDVRRTNAVLAGIWPEVVIHAQAMSDVDACERNPAQAHAQNVETVANLTEALGEGRSGGIGSVFVYVSTDYVFDGTKGTPYDETDPPRPISVYGRSKVEGERAALAYARGVVVRPSTLFGAGRSNFCDMIVREALEGGTVEAFIDQTTSPTFTDDVAEAIDELIAALAPGRQDMPRIIHTANAGGCTRLAFAHRVVDLLGRPRSCVRPIRMAQQQRPAQRPAYSALTTRVLPTITGRTLRPWDEALEAYLRHRRWLN